MLLQEKQEKKNRISERIDLAGGRFHDYEIERLLALVLSPEQYLGKRQTHKSVYRGWCSEGRFVRYETDTYEMMEDGNSIFIRHENSYRDDDGQEGSYVQDYRTGREILLAWDKLF